MTVEYEYLKGFLSDLESFLESSLSHYFDDNKWIQVGDTKNPEESWSKHKSDNSDWSKMIVVYKSKFWENIVKTKKILLEYVWKRDIMADEIDSDGGKQEEERHVYFLIQK